MVQKEIFRYKKIGKGKNTSYTIVSQIFTNYFFVLKVVECPYNSCIYVILQFLVRKFNECIIACGEMYI